MTARLCRRFGEEPKGSGPEWIKAGSWESVVRMQRWFPDWRRSRAVIGKNRPKGRCFPTCKYVSQNHTYTTNRREICITIVILFIQIYTINCIRKMFIMPGNHSQDFKKSLNCPPQLLFS